METEIVLCFHNFEAQHCQNLVFQISANDGSATGEPGHLTACRLDAKRLGCGPSFVLVCPPNIHQGRVSQQKKHNPTLGGKTDKALMMATHERRLRACHNETFQVLNLAMTCH